MERHLSTEGIGRYYEGFSNGVLWPLLHYLLDRALVEPSAWRRTGTSMRGSRKLTPKCSSRGWDLIWVHGYPLMLVPRVTQRFDPGRTELSSRTDLEVQGDSYPAVLEAFFHRRILGPSGVDTPIAFHPSQDVPYILRPSRLFRGLAVWLRRSPPIAGAVPEDADELEFF